MMMMINISPAILDIDKTHISTREKYARQHSEAEGMRNSSDSSS